MTWHISGKAIFELVKYEMDGLRDGLTVSQFVAYATIFFWKHFLMCGLRVVKMFSFEKLSTGKVSVSLQELIFGVDNKYRVMGKRRKDRVRKSAEYFRIKSSL